MDFIDFVKQRELLREDEEDLINKAKFANELANQNNSENDSKIAKLEKEIANETDSKKVKKAAEKAAGIANGEKEENSNSKENEYDKAYLDGSNSVLTTNKNKKIKNAMRKKLNKPITEAEREELQKATEEVIFTIEGKSNAGKIAEQEKFCDFLANAYKELNPNITNLDKAKQLASRLNSAAKSDNNPKDLSISDLKEFVQQFKNEFGSNLKNNLIFALLSVYGKQKSEQLGINDIYKKENAGISNANSKTSFYKKLITVLGENGGDTITIMNGFSDSIYFKINEELFKKIDNGLSNLKNTLNNIAEDIINGKIEETEKKETNTEQEITNARTSDSNNNSETLGADSGEENKVDLNGDGTPDTVKWNCPRIDLKNKDDETIRNVAAAWVKKANEYLEQIINSAKEVSGRKAKENAEKATELNAKEEKANARISSMNESLFSEALSRAKIYNNTIVEGIFRDGEANPNKFFGDIQTKYNDRFEKIVNKHLTKIAQQLEIKSRGGWGYDKANYKLSTAWLELEMDLDKALRDARKECAPTMLHKLRDDIKDDIKYEKEMFDKSEEGQLQKARKAARNDSAIDNQVEKFINYLLRNDGSDAERIIKLSIIRGLNNAKTLKDLKTNVFNVTYSIYDTSPSNGDYTKVLEYKNIGLCFDSVAKASGFSTISLINMEDSDGVSFLEKIKGELKGKLDSVNKDREIFDNDKKIFDSLIKPNGYGLLTKNDLSKATSSDGNASLRGTGVDDIALRQVLAAKKKVALENIKNIQGIVYASNRDELSKIANGEIKIGTEQIQQQNNGNNQNHETINKEMPITSNTSVVTSGVTDGLPTGYQKSKMSKAMKRKLGFIV